MATKSLRSSKPADMSMNNNAAASSLASHPAHHHIWLVTGPAGCGKTMVASHLAESLNVPYVEGDEVSSHSFSSRGRVCTHTKERKERDETRED